MISCPLCKTTVLSKRIQSINGVDFCNCTTCKAVFKHPNHHVSPQEEKARYLAHNNDVEDIGYQNFVSPIVGNILKDYNSSAKGLDFGAGTGPVIAKLLEDKEFSIALYDPFFHKDTTVLQETYDFIICCEVMEHFNTPSKEFSLLKKLLKPNGTLYCMTELVPKEVPLKDWYYINDSTHLFFYNQETIAWIKTNFGFKSVLIQERLVVFKNQ